MSPRLVCVCGIILISLILTQRVCGQSSCDHAADIVFLLDSSSGIQGDDFLLEKRFVRDVVAGFDIGQDHAVRAALIQYGETVTVDFGLGDFDDIQDIGHRDRIGSDRKNDFLLEKGFVRNLVARFDIGQDHAVRAALIQYGQTVTVDFGLGDFDDIQDIGHRIDKIQLDKGQTTETHLALETARTRLLNIGHGARPNVARLCVLITVGEPAKPLLAQDEAQLMQKAGVILLVIAVDYSNVGPVELEQLVDVTSLDHLFYAETFEELADAKFQQLVVQQACKAISMATADAHHLSSAPTHLPPSEMLNDSPEKKCQDKAADVVFVLDMSSSIWSVHFRQELAFVNDVIQTFDVDSGKTRVGLMVFSNDTKVAFELGQYNSKAEISAAVAAVHTEGGVTNTHTALQGLRDRMFTPGHGSRPGLAHVCILITDGRSSQPGLTSQLADSIHRIGIDVFAIGVGNNTHPAELLALASRPDYMFEVNGYNALPKIRDVLAYKTCEVPQADQPVCLNGMKTDIVFGLYDVGGSQREHVTTFIKSVGAELELTSGDVRIAITEANGNASFGFTTFTDVTDLQEAVDETMATRVSPLLQKMRKIYGRRSIKSANNRIAVLFVSGKIGDMKKAYTEAMRLKFFAKLLVVGVGDGVDTDQLMKMATHRNKYSPDISHVLPVHDLSELPLVVEKLLLLMCKTPAKI